MTKFTKKLNVGVVVTRLTELGSVDANISDYSNQKLIDLSHIGLMMGFKF